ncbi:hypothetical protein V8J88_06760 [Massilia sp. W12]|uniref:hypothetical protein n=1 Tax=Massilia sp. W12 TaxID=3126507 RepID=UPI0030D23FF7
MLLWRHAEQQEAMQGQADWVNQATGKTAAAPAGAAAHARQAPAPQPLPAGVAPDSHAARVILAKQQLALAEHTYQSYREGTRYPQNSRPIEEHPDQIWPNRPVEDSHAMRQKDGKTHPTITLKTTQNRIFVGAGEHLLLSMQAQGKDGKRLPLFVTRAQAQALPNSGSPAGRGSAALPSASLQFADNGMQGDLQAGDNIVSASLTPANSAFASWHGAVRIEVQYQAGDQAGSVNFDFIHTPQAPAQWSGGVRETLADGSLNFYLKARVREGGRYLIAGRVDDASGKPVALLSFNDVLAPGEQEVRLQLFGRLLRDRKPVFPLTLRDVDGYILYENADPDRAMMPRLIGIAHTSKKYSLEQFSEAEWSSEQRERYLTEYAADVERAKQDLQNLQKNGQ